MFRELKQFQPTLLYVHTSANLRIYQHVLTILARKYEIFSTIVRHLLNTGRACFVDIYTFSGTFFHFMY